MVVFSCGRCGAALTPDLALSMRELIRPAYDGRGPGPATMPRGFFAVDPEPFGTPFVPAENQDDDLLHAMPGLPMMIDGVNVVSAGPRDTIVVHPDDASTLRLHPEGDRLIGCCGPNGTEGSNQVCPCGAEVATLMADCYGPNELHFDPHRVSATEVRRPHADF
ncbi:hypothetical protein GSF22_24380 [Micromonospora echinofusca]|uniref:Uncharacterized protein n=2 Tax=Micromonospora echinofusca TaxID=47858 RepID=A0ABS3VX33_MICEH|nr:hypothetical protein [Micromonospora echinofusca]